MALFNPEAFASQIFWLAIIFALQYLLLAKLIIPKFKNIFDDRTNYINKEIATAQELVDKASNLKQDYEAKLAEAQNISATKMNAALEEIKQASAKQLAKLEESLAKDTLKQELRLQKLASSMKDQLEEISLSSAVIMIEKITNDRISAKDLKKYLAQ
jgi:F-type H+-transporting ATPase subunit b